MIRRPLINPVRGQDFSPGATFPGASKAVTDLREAAVSETHDTKDVLAALAARKSPVRPF
nr:hypothetical protein [Mycobacterium canetti]